MIGIPATRGSRAGGRIRPVVQGDVTCTNFPLFFFFSRVKRRNVDGSYNKEGRRGICAVSHGAALASWRVGFTNFTKDDTFLERCVSNTVVMGFMGEKDLTS